MTIARSLHEWKPLPRTSSTPETCSYVPPSDLKPRLVVLAISSICPAVLCYLTYRTSCRPGIAPTLILTLLWVAQLHYWIIPVLTNPLLCIPRPSDEHAILGSVRAFIDRPPHPAFVRWSRELPEAPMLFARGFLFMTNIVLITTPAAVAEVLSTRPYEFEKNKHLSKVLAKILGNGLILVEGKPHKIMRKAVTPAFQGRHVRDLVPLFWDKAGQMVKVIATAGDGPSRERSVDEEGRNVVQLDIARFASRATLDIIGIAGFGKDFNTLLNGDDALAREYESILKPDVGPMIAFFLINVLLPPFVVNNIPDMFNTRLEKSARELRRMCRDLVLERKHAVATDKGSAFGVDILSVLLRNDEIDEEGLVDQMLTFLAAGHETTSSALIWTCWLIGYHPRVQSRLRDELRASLIAEPATIINAEMIDAQSLPYLNAVCSEVLRLYPTVPLTSRVTPVDTIVAGQFIPKGTEIVICPWLTNRSRQLWGDDSDEFVPERWLDERRDTTKVEKYSFLTFLHGPRSCIGQEFARNELRCLLARLVLKFEVDLVSPDVIPKPVGAITIRPAGGMMVKLTEVA